MKMNDIVTAVNQSSKRLGFSIKKKSPELLIAAGIIGFGGAIITACVATTKAGKIIEETQDALEGINDAHEKGVTNAGELYDDRDHKRDLTITYAQTGLKFAKLYAPTAILAVSSITCVLSSHRILKKRNLALAAAYAAVDQSFKDYRGRVLDRFGEQVEKELRYNLKPAEIEETVTDDKGKEKKVKKTVDMMDPSTDIRSISPYAVVFESTHEDWSKDTPSRKEQHKYKAAPCEPEFHQSSNREPAENCCGNQWHPPFQSSSPNNRGSALGAFCSQWRH